MSLIWNDAITDRRQSDVDRVNELNTKFLNQTITPEEIAEWRTDLKGALNRSDLHRIENNIHLLSDVLDLNLTTYEDSIPERPNVSYFANIISNVTAIRNEGYILDDTPQVPSQPLNTHNKWNEIERILLDCYTILTQNFHIYTGEGIHSGEGHTIVL